MSLFTNGKNVCFVKNHFNVMIMMHILYIPHKYVPKQGIKIGSDVMLLLLLLSLIFIVMIVRLT